jgi:hypothetical protein
MCELRERGWTTKFHKFPKGMLFEEYRLFIEDTARFSDRRQAFSNVMVAVNSFLVGAIYVVLKDLSPHALHRLVAMVPLLGAGLAASCVWSKLFNEYQEIIRLRTDFLKQIECKAGKDARDGMYHMLETKFYRKGGRERGFTRLEKRLPRIFMGVYSAFMAGVILVGIWWLCFVLANCLFALS